MKIHPCPDKTWGETQLSLITLACENQSYEGLFIMEILTVNRK